MEQMGKCRFCGQQTILQHEEEMTEPQRDECATMHCECDAAKEYQQTANRRQIAKQRINELFGEGAGANAQPPEVIEILHKCVDLICYKDMKQVAFTIRTGLRCRIMEMAKDKIKVVREVSEVENFEQ